MAALQGAVESAAPVSRLHEHRSFDLADFPVPAGREEEWRFTPLRRLRSLHSDTAAASGKVAVDFDTAPGVSAVRARRGDSRLGASFVPADRVSARAFASFDEATVITVPAETDVLEPTVVSVRGEDAEGAAFGHTVVEIGPNARAVVVLDHGGSATYADNVEFIVGDGASLTRGQPAGLGRRRGAPVAIIRPRSGGTRSSATRWSRSAAAWSGSRRPCSYAGPGGDAELLGLYFADAGPAPGAPAVRGPRQPRCRSRVDYKGALQGESAHSVWIGDVLIRPEATGTDTYERNRNLLLTDGARADSVPNLEILTGEVVGAGHASASGRLEDQHLFYLMARGIPLDEARRLVIRGFFGELIAKIEVAEVRDRVTAAIEGELARLPDARAAA